MVKVGDKVIWQNGEGHEHEGIVEFVKVRDTENGKRKHVFLRGVVGFAFLAQDLKPLRTT